MKNLSVSIVVPVYNVEKYIEDCLKSITTQTYKGVIECIIVNDCSEDNSMEVIHDFIRNYSGNVHFSIVDKIQNEGISAARNSGIYESKAKYLLFVDSDDYLSEDAVENMFHTMQLYPESDMIVSGFTKNINGCDVAIQVMDNGIDYLNGKTDEIDYYQENNMVLSCWNKLIKKKWIVDNNLYFENGRVAEDDLWLFQVLINKPNFAYLHKSTYTYRIREKSITTSLALKAKLRNWVDSNVSNNIDMSRLYVEKIPSNNCFLKHILWSRLENLKYAINNGYTFDEFCVLSDKLKEQPIPLYDMPIKHAILNFCIKYIPRITYSLLCLNKVR